MQKTKQAHSSPTDQGKKERKWAASATKGLPPCCMIVCRDKHQMEKS